MAAQMKPYLVVSKGGLTLVKVTPCTVASNGTFTEVTASAVTVSTLRGLTAQRTTEKRDIRPITSPRANSVVVGDNAHFDLQVIKVNDGVDTDPLDTILLAYDYFSLTWTEGSVTGGKKTPKCYVSRGDKGDPFTDAGEVIASYTFDIVDPGSSDFYTVTVS